MIGFVLKCVTAAWSLQTQIDILYGRYSHNIGVRCFSRKNAGGRPVMEHYRILSDHVRCTWDKNEKNDSGDDTNAILPSYALLQLGDINIVHLLWLWRKQEIRDKRKTEMGHVVWQTSYYLGFPDVHILMKEPCWFLCPVDWSLYYDLRKGLTLISNSMTSSWWKASCRIFTFAN